MVWIIRLAEALLHHQNLLKSIYMSWDRKIITIKGLYLSILLTYDGREAVERELRWHKKRRRHSRIQILPEKFQFQDNQMECTWEDRGVDSTSHDAMKKKDLVKASVKRKNMEQSKPSRL